MHDVADRVHVRAIPRLAAHGLDHPALQAVVDQALCRDRAGRFSSAEDLRLALRQAMPTDEPDQAALLAILVRRQCRAEIAAADRVFVTAGPPAAAVGDAARTPAGVGAPPRATHRTAGRTRPDLGAAAAADPAAAGHGAHGAAARPHRRRHARVAGVALAAALVVLGAIALDQLRLPRAATTAAMPASGAGARPAAR
jgi:hypothetical protein